MHPVLAVFASRLMAAGLQQPRTTALLVFGMR